MKFVGYFFKSAAFMWKYKGVTLLFCMVFYFLYQSTFTWNHTQEKINAYSGGSIQSDKVAFVVIEEKHYGIKNSGFTSLLNSLQTWMLDSNKREVYLKFNSQLPTDRTKVMVLYDRGFDAFAKYSDIFSVSSFPYQFFFGGNPLISVYSADKSGTVYLDYKGKRIRLDAGESYPEWSIQDYEVVRTDIKNYGLYNKTQFKKLSGKDAFSN